MTVELTESGQRKFQEFVDGLKKQGLNPYGDSACLPSMEQGGHEENAVDSEYHIPLTPEEDYAVLPEKRRCRNCLNRREEMEEGEKPCFLYELLPNEDGALAEICPLYEEEKI